MESTITKIIEKNNDKFIKFVPLLFLGMWSSGAVFAKIGLQYSDSWSFLFIRATIALLLLSIIGYVSNRKTLRTSMANFSLSGNISENKSTNKSDHKSNNKKELGSIFLSGILIQVCYLLCYFFAIKTQMSLGLIILILGLQPILTLLLQIKQATAKQFLLLGACFVGLSISLFGYYELKELNVLGLLFSVGSLLAITAGTIVQSKTNSNPLFMLWLQTLLAWIIFVGIILVKGVHINYHWQFFLASFWMGGVVSVGAILLLMVLLKHNSVSKVSSLFFMLPILTIFIDSWFFSTGLSWLSILGAMIVCGSLWVFQKLK